MLKLSFNPNDSAKKSSNIVLFVDEKFDITKLKKELLISEYNFLSDLLKSSNKKKKILTFRLNSKKNFFLVSINKSQKPHNFEKLGGEFYNLIKEINNDIKLTINTNALIVNENFIEYFLHGLKLKSYEFDKYKTKKEKKKYFNFSNR